MQVKEQPILKFHGFDIGSVNVTQINSYDFENQPQLDSQIVPKVFFPENSPNDFTVIIDLKVEAKGFFSIAIVAFGHFSIGIDKNSKEAKPYIHLNAPAIMFPYVRSFLSMLSVNMGNSYPPIVLPPHFFNGEMEEFKLPNEQDQLLQNNQT